MRKAYLKNKLRQITIVLIIVVLISACSKEPLSNSDHENNLQEVLKEKEHGTVDANEIDKSSFYELSEETEDAVSNKNELPEDTGSDGNEPVEGDDNEIVIAVTGDICFADNWEILQNARKNDKIPLDCIDEKLVAYMKDADVCLANNEFCISNRGSELEGKAYTFRADPQNTAYWSDIGVDIVGLANNHVFDYGNDAFLDTISNLNDCNIATIGAGADEQEAYKPYYQEVNGIKLAFLAASRAEKNYMTPVAEGDYAGIAGTYSSKRFLEEITNAKKQADYVIVYVHWGTEYSETLEDAQITMGREYIDAGADVVIGAHAHILQGAEFYQERPVIYNLGNYWFNMKDIDTALLLLHIKDGVIQPQLIPCVQREGMTICLEKQEAGQKIFRNMETISNQRISIDEDGFLRSNE